MNKVIKYGLVAGLTMAAFSLAGVPATYASTADPIACDGSVVATDGDTAYIALADTTCTIKVNFNAAFYKAATIMGKYNTVKATFTGASVSNNPGTTYFTVNGEGQEATLTLNANALSTIRSALKSGNTVSVTVENSTNDEAIEAEAYKIYFTAETVQPVLSVAIDGAEAATVANSGATVDLKEDAASVVLNAQFPTAFGTGISGNQPSLSGFKSDIGVSKYSIAKSGNVATFTLTAAGIQEVLDSETGVTLTIKDTADDVVFTVTLKKKTAVELESVEAEINDDEIVLTYNTGYEGTPELAFAVEADFADVVTVENGVVKVAEAYKTAVNHDVEITVKATDGEIVKTTTVTYTIEANYTEVEAAFADGEDEMTIKVDGEAVIKVTGVEGVKYTYDYDEWDLVFEEKTNTFTVDPDYMSDEDREFTIMVNGFVAGESDDDAVVLESKELKLTVKANVKNNQTEKGSLEVLEGDGQEAVAKDGVSFRIDAPISTFSAITVMNEELHERYYNGEELTDEELASMAFCSYAWCGAAGDFSIAGKLVEGEDYILEEGSTIVTFTESFLKKLLPGTYTVGVSFADYTDLTNITFDNAVTSFTLLGSPDTGAATAVKTGAASSALATVLAAVAAAGAAVVAKFAKRK